MGTPWKSRYALRTQRMGRSIIRELLKFTQQPDIISFAGGLPAPELFPLEQCEAAACRLLHEHGATALQYGPTEGYLHLRRFIGEDGDKGKVTLRYRGREITHQDIGMRLLERIRDELADISVVEHMPKLEGRQMVMVLGPKRKN